MSTELLLKASITETNPTTIPETPLGSVLVGNHDIWREILGYFELDLARDSAAEVTEKWKTLYRIALLSSGTVDCALDSLWKSMTTLEPIVRVFNPIPGATDFQGRPLQPSMRYLLKSESQPWLNSWVFLNEPTQVDVKRVAFYLGRVKNVYLNGVQLRESTLWTVLRGILNSLDGREGGVLLPQMRMLSIDFTSFNPTYSWTHLIEPILSHTLEKIAICAPDIDEPHSLEHIFHILKWRCKNITSIVYRGKPFDFVVERCSRLPSLQILKVNFEEYSLPSDNRFFALSFPILEDAPLLAELECDIRSAQGRQARKSCFSLPISHNLTILHLIGNYRDLSYLFFPFGSGHPALPALHSLTLSICELPKSEDKFWTALFPIITTGFPGLREISIRRAASSIHHNSPLSSILQRQHLAALHIQRSLISLCLENIPNALSQNDILRIAKSWPSLEKFIISNPTGYNFYYTPDVLTEISHLLPSLKVLGLPLKLSPFNEVSSYNHISANNLNQLLITSHCSNNGESVIQIVTNLIILFPKLVSIELDESHLLPKWRNTNLATINYYSSLQNLIAFHYRSWDIRLLYQHRNQKRLTGC